jgi:hypothetical protein
VADGGRQRRLGGEGGRLLGGGRASRTRRGGGRGAHKGEARRGVRCFLELSGRRSFAGGGRGDVEAFPREGKKSDENVVLVSFLGVVV